MRNEDEVTNRDRVASNIHYYKVDVPVTSVQKQSNNVTSINDIF